MSMLMRAINNGCTSKPTPRSETARLSSNTFMGFGNDGVFLSASIVKIFSVMAKKDEKALTMPLIIRDATTMVTFQSTLTFLR